MLELMKKTEEISLYARKNIQKAKQLLENGKNRMRKYQDDEDIECLYIMFVLCIYLIKTLIYFQKTFQLFTNIPADDEDRWRKDLNDWLLKGNTDFVRGLNIASRFQSRSSKTIVAHALKKSRHRKTSADQNTTPDMNNEESVPPPPKLPWKGQINVLVDVFLQLTEEYKIKGEPILQADHDTLCDFLIRNFTDKDGNDLSPYTINTILKPYRTDKRLHPDSPKRIDLSDIIK